MQEKRRAQQSGDDAEFELRPGRHQPDGQIGEDCQHGTGEKARQQQSTRMVADPGTQQMRYDETDEPNHSRHGDRCADRKSSTPNDQPLSWFWIETEAMGRFLTEGQGIQSACSRDP